MTCRSRQKGGRARSGLLISTCRERYYAVKVMKEEILYLFVSINNSENYPEKLVMWGELQAVRHNKKVKMKLEKTLKIFVIISWICSILYVISSIILESSLPTNLQNYLRNEVLRERTEFDLILDMIMIILMLWYIISTIGLYLTKNWTKISYTIACISIFILTLFFDPIVDHAISAVISSINSVIMGMILGLLYFTNVFKNNIA